MLSEGFVVIEIGLEEGVPVLVLVSLVEIRSCPHGTDGTEGVVFGAIGLSHVETEVDVGPQGFETMDLVVDLDIADSTVGVTIIHIVID